MIKRFFTSLLAALSMYTRIPAWRLATLERQDYAEAVHWLPFVGLVTGGTMAGVFYLSYQLLALPILTAIILALAARLLLTGAFHEDGLGDFFDGFGGGRDREGILRIMKDSHVGSYAVIGYIIYYALLISILTALPTALIPSAFILADVLGKLFGTLPVYYLPYARREEDSKIGLSYHRGGQVQSLLLLGLFFAAPYILGYSILHFLILPLILIVALGYYIYRQIGGYTGDTCGACILLSELMVLLGMLLFGFRASCPI